jgi:hypothetical protein
MDAVAIGSYVTTGVGAAWRTTSAAISGRDYRR